MASGTRRARPAGARREGGGRRPCEASEQFDLGLAADVTDYDAMAAAVATTVERFGGLDVVVANAGIAARVTTARASDPDQFERILEVNLLGVWRTVRAALPHVIANGGHVVVIASIYAFANGIGTAAYAMARPASSNWATRCGWNWCQHGASASVAYFGFIDTEMVRKWIDRDPLADRLLGHDPAACCRSDCRRQVAGEAIVRRIERRKARIIRPRRWTILSVLRGVLNPLIQARAERDARVQALLKEVDGRGP